MSEPIRVRTKDDLNHAVKDGATDIMVCGELAETLRTALRLKGASKWAVGLLGVAVAAIPFTGGLSVGAAASVATLSGLEIAVIIAVSGLGLALILSILREYDSVMFKARTEHWEAELQLKRRRRK